MANVPDCLTKLADALESWEPKFDGTKSSQRLHRFDINLQTSSYLIDAVNWLKINKTREFAIGFEEDIKELYKSVHDFYDMREEGSMDEAEYRVQIQCLQDDVWRMSEYVQQIIESIENSSVDINGSNDCSSSEGSEPNLPKRIEQWAKLTIEIVDDDTVRYQIDEKWIRATNEELGFWDNRNSRPNKLWTTFLVLAKCCNDNKISGIVDGRDISNSRTQKPIVNNLQKDLDRICDTLKEYFGPTERPIRYIKKECCWRTHFTLRDPRPF